ncbi:hypothetical protein GOA63_22350 [Sinorhizobium meliloti]|uniref:hypothetical protein n=1 Tax=Rhizobium meliloti TaxID=382 RepID=UPI001294E9C3|nr:hypothetical protein [Sinorhizobium meliloti]MDW9594954.1 hypothetical protein [Sinorhizobium meliloti]MDX0140424.1 hypothetical protein [Sinorhizobium meliloti]MDX0189933.1 hypothetical protein [Sinorhizobium meliloti]MDX0382812.1 hypothetical protein [Sinorhizobium meliloti]MQV09933.1 hypothetical protein [Sinorhizobium meliloti]
MPVTSYTDYLRDLKTVIDSIGCNPLAYGYAVVEIAICRNGYGYKSRQLLSHGSLTRECRTGRLNADCWHPDNEGLGQTETERFFDLPEIYAYSDRALTAQNSPLSRAPWDATLGIFDVRVCEHNGRPRRQRMLFAGFADSIHAEFFLAADHDLVVHDHNPGSQFFEWRPDETEYVLLSAPATFTRHADSGLLARCTSRSIRPVNPAS